MLAAAADDDTAQCSQICNAQIYPQVEQLSAGLQGHTAALCSGSRQLSPAAAQDTYVGFHKLFPASWYRPILSFIAVSPNALWLPSVA